MKIGIFGGTFNPTHKGHLESLVKVQKKLGLDKILIFPAAKTPLKDSKFEKVSAKDRLNILKASLKDFNQPWLKIDTFEIDQGGTSYTYKTVEYLRNKYPEAELWFIMGDDRYKDFNKWNNYEYLRENLKIAILKRHNVKKLTKIDKGDVYFTNEIIPISSTETISKLTWDNLYPSAKKYIAKHNLYLKELTYTLMGERRLEHVLSVATHAKRLYRKNAILKYRDWEAYMAGMLHDNAKYMSEKKAREFMGPDYDDIPYKALHGFVTSKWLIEIYGMKNKRIPEAIKNHTLANAKMTLLDKCVYVADKIANDRKDKKNFIWRRLAYKDLELTFRKTLYESSEFVKSKGGVLPQQTIDALDKYKFDKTLKEIRGKKNDKDRTRN